VREVTERYPDLRVVPRAGAKDADDLAWLIDAYAGVGCEGVVASFGTDPEKIVREVKTFGANRR
jgi:hypothetical protein